MAETVNLYQVLNEMRKSTEPFSVEFHTFSHSRQEGGEVVKMDNVLNAGQQKGEFTNYMIGFKEVDKPDGKVRRCYIWSIMKYNGKKVLF